MKPGHHRAEKDPRPQDGPLGDPPDPRAAISLVRDGDGLALTDGHVTLRPDFGHLSARIRQPALNRELLVRAAKVKSKPDGARLTAIDATAGLGEDSFILAAAGFTVTLFEKNALIAALLQDCVIRAQQDPALAFAATRMHPLLGDGIAGLANLDESPDVVLLDPMFPARRKTAAVKKKLQLLQRLESPCEDERALIEAALAAKPRKVVVKRPVKGPHLAGRKPDYSLSGKAVRFDCYAT